MSFSVFSGTRSNTDPFVEFFNSLERPNYLSQCTVCNRSLCYVSAIAEMNRNNNRNSPRSNFAASGMDRRLLPVLHTMPHPTGNNVATRNNYVPPANQPNTSAAYQSYPRAATYGSAMIRAPNPSSVNYGGLQAPAGFRYPPYYPNTVPVYAPDMRSQYNIQIRVPTADDLPMDDDFVVAEINSGTSPEASSVDTEEVQEIVRQKCNARLRKWFIVNGLPFSMIGTKAFTEFVNEASPSYVLPTLEEFKSDMRADYLQICEIVRGLLANTGSVCITTETLVSQNNCQYLAMTAHYIDRHFKECTILFDCCEILRFDRDAIVSVIDLSLAKFHLTGKVTTFVSDDKVLVKEMFGDNYNWIHFQCYGLELNEIAEGLKQVAIEFFEKYCPTIRVNADACLQDVIETAQRVLPTLSNLIEEYNICVDIIKVLKPFEELILFFGHRYIWISEFMLVNRSLVSAYEKLSTEDFSEDIKQAVQTVLEKLTKLAEYEYIQSLAYATFLDPRYKNTEFSNSDEASSIKENFIEELTSMFRSRRANTEENTVNADNNRMSIFNVFDKMMEESHVRVAVDEVNRYMDAIVQPRHGDPLKWWADNVLQFPNLAKMAVTHLNMHISSAPVNQIFTNIGKLIKENRNTYDTVCLPMTTFLSGNPQFMDHIFKDL